MINLFPHFLLTGDVGSRLRPAADRKPCHPGGMEFQEKKQRLFMAELLDGSFMSGKGPEPGAPDELR